MFTNARKIATEDTENTEKKQTSDEEQKIMAFSIQLEPFEDVFG
jgi:hypothetical protein